MDNDTAKIGAQEMDHESPKEDVGPDLEKKITQESRPDVPQPSIAHADECKDATSRDVEAVETQVEDSEPVKVPRSQRRGLFGRFTILAEVKEPKHYPQRIKWYITFVVALAAVAAPMGSAIIFRMTPPKKAQQLWLTSPSFPHSNFGRPTYLSHDYEPLSCPVYAIYVNIPTVVVFLFRDSRTTHHLSHIVHPLLTIQYPCSVVKKHRHAYHYANVGWWGSGQRAGSRRWYNS